MYAAGCPLQSMVLVLSHALSEGLGRAGNQNFPYFMLELVHDTKFRTRLSRLRDFNCVLC